jgi:dGTPase
MDDLDNFHETVISTLTSVGVMTEGAAVSHEGAQKLRIEPYRATQEQRCAAKTQTLALGATMSSITGDRLSSETPDDFFLCFEKDVEKIQASSVFRRMAGKCQVFIAPRNDMIRTRLTHVLEVSHLAKHMASMLGLNRSLCEAIALSHDCGHGPFGHPAEEAFAPYIKGGFDHAVWGAGVVLRSLNLCTQTLDGVRNHSWKRPCPATPEGVLVAWSDRISYVCHDWDDAVRTNVITVDDLPAAISAATGVTQKTQLDFFMKRLLESTRKNGFISMDKEAADILNLFRTYNFENIYLREASLQQAKRAIGTLTSLVDYYIENTKFILDQKPTSSGTYNISTPDELEDPAFLAVRYVDSMTDRYACGIAREILGVLVDSLPLES